MANYRKGIIFRPHEETTSLFDKLLDIFMELITHTSGDFDEAIEWLKELDKAYDITTKEYTIDDFIEDLKKKGMSVKRLNQMVILG